MRDLHTHISDLEAEIERLFDAAHRSRKIGMAAQIIAAAGGLVFVGLLVGVLRFSPELLVIAIAALLGGIALIGTNQSTSDEIARDLSQAEAVRASLIDSLGLQTVEPARPTASLPAGRLD